jgi:hypothetical protein
MLGLNAANAFEQGSLLTQGFVQSPIQNQNQNQVQTQPVIQTQPQYEQQLQPQIQVQIQPQAQSFGFITPTIIPPIIPPSSTRAYADILSKEKKKKLLAKAYMTLTRRRGKWFELGKPTLKQEAIKRGERYTTQTLGASFKIQPTQKFVEGVENGYNPNPLVFRTYAIRGRTRVPLENTWIQKAGTRREGTTVRGARLASTGERAEIRNALRRRSSNQKINLVRKNVKSGFFQ